MSRPEQDSLIRALLGPRGPELTCEECFEQLDAYVELELGRADPDQAVSGMRAHLEGCPACREDHAGLLALVSDGVAGGEREPPPGDD